MNESMPERSSLEDPTSFSYLVHRQSIARRKPPDGMNGPSEVSPPLPDIDFNVEDRDQENQNSNLAS